MVALDNWAAIAGFALPLLKSVGKEALGFLWNKYGDSVIKGIN